MFLNRIAFYAVLIFENLFRFVPFWLLYIFSDLIFLLFYYVFRYRKTVVFENLRNSFPGKEEREITRIARGFYRHLCDVLIESLKGATMKEEAVVKHYRINGENLDRFYPSNRNVLCVAGHYGNWEWAGISAGSQLRHKPVGFYKPLSNPLVDNYVQKTRVRGRSVLASIANTHDAFRKSWGEPVAYYMVADQSPSSTRHAYWIKFLNQDTATLHGPEKYARLLNLPVVFADIQKTGRGQYEVEFRVICEEPGQLPDGEITKRYMEMLEARILDEPRYYLWSHRRWKHKRE